MLAVATAGTKIATGWLGAARAGVGRRGRARAGLTLVPRGEFSIVIAGLGVGAGLEPQLAPLAAAYVLVLALAGPVLMRFPDALPALPARFAPDGARGPSTLRRP